jgi:hypothetical protein
MKKEMKKAFFVLLVLSISLSFSIVQAEEPREFKIVKPEAGTLGAAFSGIWEGEMPTATVGRRGQLEVATTRSNTVVIEEVSPPKIKGLYMVSGFPPGEIRGEIRDPETVFIVLKTGELTLTLTSENTIQAELRSLQPGPPKKWKLFKK